MSLCLLYFDRGRAIAASDDCAVVFDAAGEPRLTGIPAPKFSLIGDRIVALVGRNDCVSRLRHGFTRLAGDFPAMGIVEFAPILRDWSKKAFDDRQQTAENLSKFDALECAVLGYDQQQKRVRCYATSSSGKFQMHEITENPAARILCLGHYDKTDWPLLQGLTAKMEEAHEKRLPWVAAQLRDAISEFSEKYPLVVGPPSYFAALNTTGFFKLPDDFPLPPAQQAEVAAAHLVSLTKEDSFYGTTVMFLGSIMTPAAGAPDTVGNNDGGVGSQTGMLMKLQMSAAVTNGLGGSGLLGNGAATNLSNAVDADGISFATQTVTGNGSANESIVLFTGIPGITRRYQSLTLQILIECTQNNLSPNGILATFQIAYSSTGPSGSFSTLLNVVPPNVYSKQTIMVSLPVGTNPSQVCVLVSAVSFSTHTSGSCILHVFDCNLAAVE